MLKPWTYVHGQNLFSIVLASMVPYLFLKESIAFSYGNRLRRFPAEKECVSPVVSRSIVAPTEASSVEAGRFVFGTGM